MSYPINIDKITPSLEYYPEVALLLEESREYLRAHAWCDKINNGWLFVNLGKVLCILLYQIENNQSPDDNLIWMMVGDFPPVYLDSQGVDNTREVVDVYIYLVNDWIEHVEDGRGVEECFPVLSNWTNEKIEMLKIRMELLKSSILAGIPEISFKEIYDGNNN
jgi:hypothetical protein